MRKINVAEFISLDGVIQAPGEPEEDTSGPPAWIRAHADAVSSAAVKKGMNKPFDLLLGRITFELWARFWPQHNDAWPAVNTATKYVASNTMTSHEWQPSVFLNGDIAEKITKIKQQQGPDLHVYGSANLVQTLMKHDLVDAFWLKIFPITLGGAKRLFCRWHDPSGIQGDGKHSHLERRHYRELRACRRSPNRKSINLRRIAGVSEAGARSRNPERSWRRISAGWPGLLILRALPTQWGWCTQRS
jgi:dihydrofolate reductase